MQDRTIDPARGNMIAIPLFLGSLALVALPHYFVWGENIVLAGLRSTNLWMVLGLFFVGIVVHEAIHGITWALAGRLKWSELKFGIMWHALTPYAHARVPIPARAYRLGAAMPGIAMGLLPAVAGLATGIAGLSASGALFLAVASGDILVIWLIRDVPGTTLVKDHPSRFGCEVVG